MNGDLTYFFVILVCTIFIGYSLVAFIKGKFPMTGSGGHRNRVLWGNPDVNPKLLTGTRARIMAFLFILIFGLIALAMGNQNSTLSNSVSTLIGLGIGAVSHKWLSKYVENN